MSEKKFATNAERQKAYRNRKACLEADVDLAYDLGYQGVEAVPEWSTPVTVAWARGVWRRQGEQADAVHEARKQAAMAAAAREAPLSR